MIIQKKKNNKKIIIILVSIILLFLIIITAIKAVQANKQRQYMEQEKQRVSQYTSITDFKTLEEVAIYLNCNFIKQEEVKNDNVQYKVYMKLPMSLENAESSNKNFVENLIQYSAYVLKYKNFCIIDEENNSNIVVYCNQENQLVETYSINGTANYWGQKVSQNNIENFNKVTSIKVIVSSDILNKIVKNNWSTNGIELGTAESLYRGYNIYFDEGYQTRIINKKVFNLVFTEKHKDAILNGLTVNSNKEEIEKALGKPQFESGSLIGYKATNMYVFFYNKQVSIYPIETYTTDKIAEIIDKYEPNYAENSFIDEIRDEWEDYDIFEYGSNYVKLQYTLKGISIKFDSSNNRGINFYNNYKGKILKNATLEDIINHNQQLPENMYIQNEDLVFKQEQERINTLDNTTSKNNYATLVVRNTSKLYKVASNAFEGNKNLHNIRFISIDNQYPNTELREPISWGIWYDDTNFIFSVKDRGIFSYNVQKQEYKTLKTGTGNFVLLRIENGKLYYDTESLDITL